MIDFANETQEIKVFQAVKIVEVKKRKGKIPKCWNCKNPLEPGVNNIVCPKCGVEFAEKPKTEAKYHTLQKKYLVNRDSKTLGEMLLIVEEIAYNIICGKLKSAGKFLDDERIKDKTSWVVEKMFKYYSKPDFLITMSAIDYISQVCLYVLYGHAFKKIDKNEISANTPISKNDGKDEGGDQTIMDRLSNDLYLEGQWDIENMFFKNIYRDNLINEIIDYTKIFLHESAQRWGFTHAFNLTQLIYYFYSGKGQNFFNKWFETNTNIPKLKEVESACRLHDHFEAYKIGVKKHLQQNSKGGYEFGGARIAG